MIRAAKICVAEVEELVDAGSIPFEQIHLPGKYVHRIVKSERTSKRIDKLTTRDPNKNKNSLVSKGERKMDATLTISSQTIF